jgi:hypothetical protein
MALVLIVAPLISIYLPPPSNNIHSSSSLLPCPARPPWNIPRLHASLDWCGPPGGPNWTNYNLPSATTVTATVVSCRPTDSTVSVDLESQDSDVLLAHSRPTSLTMITHSPKRDRAKPPSGGDTSVHGEHDALLPLEPNSCDWQGADVFSWSGGWMETPEADPDADAKPGAQSVYAIDCEMVCALSCILSCFAAHAAR